ncbi:MATE family efflux transporter [Pseudahrensia aquimaris]|uniref:MATE family efflux transporter n=1 Tax=Pseudahrensia aquimaris TaxID=744461 RepID=A0ABW3FK07_9HYPH
MSDSRDLTTGPVWRSLLIIAGPMVFGILAAISVSVVDTYYVGKLGTAPLAALSFIAPASLTITSLAIGLSAGASSVVARAIGSSDTSEAKRLSTDSLGLALVVVVLITVTGYLTIKPLFSLLGAEGDVLDMIVRYMQIWYLSMPFLIIPMVANAIVRAVGNSFWPSAIMVASAIINIAITPAFIFGWGPIPALNIEGAAWGTLIARVFTLFLGLWLIVYREEMVAFAKPTIEELVKSWRQVLSIGLPAAFGNATNPLGITVVTGIVAIYGEAVVAGFGVATRIESLAVIPMLALSSAIGPVAGQNWGAAKVERVRSALKISFAVCFGWALLLAVVFQFFAESVIGLFSSDPEVMRAAASYLHIVPLSVWGYGWVIVAAGGYNSLGKPFTGLGMYLTRTALFYIPLSYAASLLSGSQSVFSAIAIANTIAGAAVGFYSLWWLRKNGEEAAG